MILKLSSHLNSLYQKLRIVRIYYRKYHKLRGIFLNPRIRDFLEINMKPRISEDGDLGGCELGGFTIQCTYYRPNCQSHA